MRQSVAARGRKGLAERRRILMITRGFCRQRAGTPIATKTVLSANWGLCMRNSKGFTLIELLIVVAVIGISAAILIPNLIDALQKAKQKRAVADMRNVGGAWFTWLTDQLSAASAGVQQFSWSDFGTDITAQDLLDTVLFTGDPNPTYIQSVPDTDPEAPSRSGVARGPYFRTIADPD